MNRLVGAGWLAAAAHVLSVCVLTWIDRQGVLTIDQVAIGMGALPPVLAPTILGFARALVRSAWLLFATAHLLGVCTLQWIGGYRTLTLDQVAIGMTTLHHLYATTILRFARALVQSLDTEPSGGGARA